MTAERTVIMREYPKAWTKGDEPYYPVSDEDSVKLLEKYQSETRKLKQLLVGGRLGLFRYFDMDQAILNALSVPV